MAWRDVFRTEVGLPFALPSLPAMTYMAVKVKVGLREGVLKVF